MRTPKGKTDRDFSHFVEFLRSLVVWAEGRGGVIAPLPLPSCRHPSPAR